MNRWFAVSAVALIVIVISLVIAGAPGGAVALPAFAAGVAATSALVPT